MLTKYINFIVYVCVCVCAFLLLKNSSLFRMILNVYKMFVIDKFYYICSPKGKFL